MDNPEITSLSEFIDRPERLNTEDQELLIDVFVDYFMADTRKHICRFCTTETFIRKGERQHCPGCLDKGDITCVEWL